MEMKGRYKIMPKLTNFPKLHCPFIRKIFRVHEGDWGVHGSALQLRTPEVYLVVDKVNQGYDWVFKDENTIAVEKLNGTNIKLLTKDGKLTALQNRKNIIDPLQIIKGRGFILDGIFQAIDKGYIDKDSEQVGELIGPKLQGNPYKLTNHLWYPFTKAIKHLSYRSFHEHERTFDNWSSWFENYLISRFASKRGEKGVMAEGIVFYNFKRKDEGKIFMAKLRRDMYYHYYSNKIQIYNYNKNI